MITFIRNGDLPYELSYETADVPFDTHIMKCS